MLTWSKDKAIGEHTIISKFLKGVFNLRPSLPKSSVTWDTRNVLEFLRSWYPLKHLSLFQLSIKTVLLMLLISGQRGQTIWVLKIKDVENKYHATAKRLEVILSGASYDVFALDLYYHKICYDNFTYAYDKKQASANIIEKDRLSSEVMDSFFHYFVAW